jgi:hypothetical protein
LTQKEEPGTILLEPAATCRALAEDAMPDTSIQQEQELISVESSVVAASPDLPLPLLFAPIVFGRELTGRDPHDWARPPEGTFRYSEDTQTAQWVDNDAYPQPVWSWVPTTSYCRSTCWMYSCGFMDHVYDDVADDTRNDS